MDGHLPCAVGQLYPLATAPNVPTCHVNPRPLLLTHWPRISADFFEVARTVSGFPLTGMSLRCLSQRLSLAFAKRGLRRVVQLGVVASKWDWL